MMLAPYPPVVMKRSPLDDVSDPATHKRVRRERDNESEDASETRRTESPGVVTGAGGHPYDPSSAGVGAGYAAAPGGGPSLYSPTERELNWLQPEPFSREDGGHRRQDHPSPPSAAASFPPPPQGGAPPHPSWHQYYHQQPPPPPHMQYSPRFWGEGQHPYQAPMRPYYWNEQMIPPHHMHQQRHSPHHLQSASSSDSMSMPVAAPTHAPPAPTDAPSTSYLQQPSISVEEGDTPSGIGQPLARSTSNVSGGSSSGLVHGGATAPQSSVAAAAVTSSSAAEPSSENANVVPLALPSDQESLSEFHILVRNQIDLFAAEQKDVDSSMQGRNRPIVLHQVGVRCRWCAARLPPSRRPRGAVYFPSKLSGLYQAAQNMTTNHFVASCQMIPMDVQQRLRELKEKKTYILGGGKGYWSTGGRIRGICEVDNRLFFEHSKPKSAEESASGDKADAAK